MRAIWVLMFWLLAGALWARVENCENNNGLSAAEALMQAPELLNLLNGDMAGAIEKSPLCPQELLSVLQASQQVLGLDGDQFEMVQQYLLQAVELAQNLEGSGSSPDGDVTGDGANGGGDGTADEEEADSEPPVIEAQSGYELTLAKGASLAPVTIIASAYDEVDGAVNVRRFWNGAEIGADVSFPEGEHVVNLIATDQAGNSAERAVNILVNAAPKTDEAEIVELAPPRIEVNENVEVRTKPDRERVTLQARAFDGEGKALGVQYVLEDGREIPNPYEFPYGETKVTASARDKNGQVVRKSFVVNVEAEPKLAPEDWRNLERAEREFEQDMTKAEEWILPRQILVMISDDLAQLPIREIEEKLELARGQVLEVNSEAPASLVVNGQPEDLERLARLDDVLDVGHDFMVSTFAATQSAAHSAALDWLDRDYEALDGQIRREDEMRAVRVYVVDTGIREDHLALEGRIVDWRGVAAGIGGERENACNRHGTAMASLIGGEAYGVSGNVEFVDVNVASCGVDVEPGAPMMIKASDIVRALSWIRKQEDARQKAGEETAAVINMSLGAPAGWGNLRSDEFKRSMAIDQLVEELVERNGAVIVAAAGNSAINACHIVPAYIPEVITVGAVDLEGRLLKFGEMAGSNWGDCVNSYALGEDLASADSMDVEGFFLDRGTSGAAAVVAGLAAHFLATGKSRDEVLEEIVAYPFEPENPAQYFQALGEPGAQAEGGQTMSFEAVSLASGHRCVVKTYDGTLNLRTKADANAKKIGTLVNGDVVEILRGDDRWRLVETKDGMQAFAAASGGAGQFLYELDGISPCE